MIAMSSTASHKSQAPLHLQRQAMLYHLDMTLGNLIQKARKAKKLSLEKLGGKMGVSRQLVWQWENGESDPRKHLAALALHLEVPIGYFYASKGSASALEAKIKLLAPEQQEAVEAMIDVFLRQQEGISAVPAPKKA